MSIVNSIRGIQDWLKENVCPLVNLKVPDDSAVDETYPYELAHPEVFVMFLPTKDRVSPNLKSPFPSVCVQLVQGEDKLEQHRRSIRIRLSFSAWDPGHHDPDAFIPEGDTSFTQRKGAAFQKNGEGWQDVWSFVDVALRLIEESEYVGGLRVMKEEGITFGPFTEQDAVPDFYPYWFAWVQFSAEEGLTRDSKSYGDLL